MQSPQRIALCETSFLEAMAHKLTMAIDNPETDTSGDDQARLIEFRNRLHAELDSRASKR